MGVLGFAVKSSLVGGIVYYTTQEGLWSSPEKCMEFYSKMCNNISPYVTNNIPKEVINELPEMPKIASMPSCAGALWNKGVKTSIKFIADLPIHASNGIDSIMSMPAVKDTLNSSKDSEKPAITDNKP